MARLGYRRFAEDNGLMTERAPFARDEPVALSEDAFGHRDYTEALLSIITDDSPPPTVGVFGPWGVGKSTIIGGIQDRLSGGDTAFIYFDAWRYEGDSLRRQFLIDAANQLKNDNRLSFSYCPREELRELHFDTQEIDESLGFSKARLRRAALIGVGFAVIAALLVIFGVFDSVLAGNFGQTVLASIAAFTVGTFATLLSQAVVVNANTATIRALRDPDRFAAKFTDLLKALRPQRVVIAIDNLDRCSPESAIEMLSTIKTYLEPAVAGESGPAPARLRPSTSRLCSSCQWTIRRCVVTLSLRSPSAPAMRISSRSVATSTNTSQSSSAPGSRSGQSCPTTCVATSLITWTP